MKKFANYLWVEKENDIYTVSMTPELQDDLGTVGYVEFTVGDTVEKDEIILNLEASKTVMGVLCPLAGRVVAKNEAAIDQPVLLNSAKAEEHWLIKLTDVNSADFDGLEDA